ncbi:capsid scaffolding protein [Pectobacterium phage phiPccP-1]|uniref:Internal virion protein gp14 n=1 Tax=Pectobacterium phage DU_PP_II TaxID=2041489 RepID=A0A2D2W5X6_9CAUD|nr:internal virion protein [Pectobacterium phage DU_PP_II]ATS93701.1 capsid scaffolding protein [Pectobacterium phage DU_PP_II]QPI17218.1 capsid scaffolding protein [Pectobacterium phage phiPccP-1]
MCWMAAIPITMSAMQMVGSSKSQADAQSAQTNQSRQQAIQMVKEMNWKDSDMQLQQMDTLDSASSQLTEKSMQNVQNMGLVRAALGESNLEGNSMRRVAMVTEGNMIREANGITENYKRDYASIFAKRVGNRESTISQIESMQAAEAKKKGMLESIVDPLGIGVSTIMGIATGGNPMFKGLNKSILDKVTNTSGQPAGISAAVGTKK